MNGFHSFPDKEKAYSETARVLKKGGMFCGCYYIREENKITDFTVDFVLSKRGWFNPPFQTKEEALNVLNNLGFLVKLYHSRILMQY